ncbi:hypothetical protein [Verrucosispora sp. WMMD1129]|uniref:hypothetical protein n=1 Tax=Verrucosispora sp. WMMD1129 TaxID=3016093 RepID=UPI00249BAF1D|nr:hypothetical protein [Verrucosispora sp. WMMD1129]WFE45282.1 hypothetical protein O7624_13455 [Verrucosispora sp. WMMD1129]
MSRIDEPVDPATLWEVANRVLDHHAGGGTCQACGPDDCPQTQWALAEVAAAYGRWDTASR